MIRQRRRLLQAVCATVTAATLTPWSSVAAVANELEAFVKGPAVPDQPLRQISPHVWIVWAADPFPTPENQGMMSNITFVIGTKGVAVIDTGASLQIGEMAIRQLRKLTKLPVIALIHTHYHGDHWLGNQAFVAAYGQDLPIYAHPGTTAAIKGIQGSLWLSLMAKWTNQASAGTEIVPPNHDINHGASLSLGGVNLRIHHYGQAHTHADLCVEVVEDRLTCVGDVAMDRRIANMDDGSYLGTFRTYDALEKTPTQIWLPAHGMPGTDVLRWNRALFAGIYQSCEQAVKAGQPLEAAKALVLQDPRVASRRAETHGFENTIGKYVSIAYLEAEAALF
jgi:glyoxylase-like metal-dependent hydrolase (beta-lactamase superfamily II)